MPSRVDHDERRTELAEAVWRLIRREGVRGGIGTRSRARGRAVHGFGALFLQHPGRAPAVRHARHHHSSSSSEADEGVRDLCRTCLTDLSRLGRIAEDRDLDLEIERLWSLLDGLTLHILLKMAPMSAARVAKILRIHLRDLQHPAT